LKEDGWRAENRVARLHTLYCHISCFGRGTPAFNNEKEYRRSPFDEVVAQQESFSEEVAYFPSRAGTIKEATFCTRIRITLFSPIAYITRATPSRKTGNEWDVP